ncbi:hypothetical protein QQ045_011081 [Rhodiola kirilowii]
MGGEAKVTVMVLKVDLACQKCYRKIKKVLCSTPQIRDQLFDEKSNTVTISVLCCTPDKVADKICSKAGGTLKGIDIKPSQPPAKPPGDKPKDGPPPQQKQGPPPGAEKPKSGPPPQGDKPKGGGGGDGEKPKPPPQQQQMPTAKKVDFAPMGGGPPPQQQFPMGPPPQAGLRPNQPAALMSPEFIPVAGYPSIFPPVVYYDGGPYYQNQGMAAMAAPQRLPQQQPIYQYDGYTGRPVTDYFTEQNPSTCSVM